MKRLLIIICVLACTFFAKAKDRTQYVNPLMGSQSTFELSTGNTYPAIARPWGMNFWTPQTGKWVTAGNTLIPLTRFAVSSRRINPVRGLTTTDSSLSCP